jgi:hypothetical protein
MLSQELPDRITLMPTCSINIQPNGIAAKPAIEVLQYLEKSLPVSAFCLDHSSTTQERSHPTGNIQAFLMLAGCRNLQPFADDRPTTAKPRMQGKTAFVLKNNCFFRPQRFEFFLGSWQTSLRPRPLLGDRHDWPASTDTQADASNTGPDVLSALYQTAAVNGSLAWGHPSGRGSIQTSEAILPDEVPIALQSSVSCGLDGPTAFSGSGRLLHSYLPPASSDLHSSGSGQEPRISSSVAAPPALKGGWLSLCRSKLLVLSRPGPAIALWLSLLNLRGKFSCPPE